VTLALVGSGEYLPPMERVDRYLIGCLNSEPSIVCLPTAAGTEGPERVRYWSELGVSHFNRLGVNVKALPIIDRVSADDETLIQPIREANFVYLSGGKPDYLYKTFNGSLAWKAIQEVLSNGGVLAGCSAGAMIMGESIPSFPGSQKAFGLLPGTVIAPHFDEIPAWLLSSIRLLAGRRLTLVGVEGNTALVVRDGLYDVVGTGGVTLWKGNRRHRYLHGEPISL
jgi:cyanophycinase